MKINIELSPEEVELAIKNIVADELHKPEGLKAIRQGVIDYLIKFNMFEFVKLLKSRK